MKCLFCGKELTGTAKKFCNSSCQNGYYWKLTCEKIEQDGKFPNMGAYHETDRKVAKKYLEYKKGHKCSICGIEEWNGKPIIMVVDHIDGNPSNSSIDNIRLVCPNCDSQLLTYKNRRGRKKESNSCNDFSRSKRREVEYERKLQKFGLKRTERIRAEGICPICKQIFKKSRMSQKYCSKQCLHEANRRNPSGFCVH